MIFRGFRYKLAPSPEQESSFRQFAGVCRLIYNLALEQRRDWWRQFEANTGTRLNYVAQCRELTALRAEYDWIAAVSQTCQQQALHDLDKAYSGFFKGIIRRAKALRRAAKLSARRARIRRDWQHKTSLDLTRRFGTVAIEDLKIKNMTASAKGTAEKPGRMVRQKAGLNRSILNQGWFAFETILAYKLAERGGTLVKVNPAYTSQTCSDCGTIDKQSRESQARFVCRHCGFRAHADHNAAINILRRNTASMRIEEGHKLSDEVRTGSRFMLAENLPVLAGGRC